MSLFDHRQNIKPYQYGDQLIPYLDAIRQSYWIHDEFDFTQDVQDFHTNLTPTEKTVATRSMLAISQIEIDVKTFWTRVYDRLPVPEVAFVTSTFSESEVRHVDAYSHLLEVLGLNEAFQDLQEVPAIQGRIEYLNRFKDLKELKESRGKRQSFVHELVLFSIFVEFVSLFSQFYVLTSFDKRTNRLKGVANAVEATSKEELLHGLFGVELFKILQREEPELFPEGFKSFLGRQCLKAYKAEMGILDWIFEDGAPDFLSRDEVNDFLKRRFNEAFRLLDLDPIFEPPNNDAIRWFEDDILTTKDNDFFNKRGTTYTKMTQSVEATDLF